LRPTLPEVAVHEDANQPEGDYEYDSAHEATAGPEAATPGAVPEQERVQVDAPTADDDGDYGYDLAHDMPPG
jgi:hypothetical protein